MKQLFLILLLLPITINASELMLVIEKKAAKLSSCSVEQPCTITVEFTSKIYVVMVRKSTKITDYGILKYTTGSVTYHKFNKDGVYIESKYTT